MKTIQINKVLFLLLIIVGFTTSCVQDDDYDLPDTTIVDPELPEGANIVNIASVLGVAGQQDEGEQFTFSETNDFMEGYVISTDEGGNFFREIILQDKAENPTAGIKIALFVNPLFTKYEVGRKIYVGLDGFTVGTSNGVITLGIPDGNFIDEAPAQFESKIYRTSEIAEIVPLPLSISDFSEQYENLFVKIDNVQFLKEDVDNNLTFASESFDSFDGERTIESCETEATTIFSTSTFADFNNLTLPKDSGSIQGVLSRTFEGDAFIIAVNTIADLVMEGERCDPEVVDCGLATTEGSTILFEDDFESQTNGSPISGNGWTNFAEAGTNPWEAFNDSENNPSMGRGAKVDPYGSGDDSVVSWLITPTINFDAQEGETITFTTSNSFSDDSNMRVLISLDWDGTEENITTATWTSLSSATIVDDEDFYQDIIDSGVVDLSCIEGEGHIAFKYIGSGNASNDGTFELDDIKIAF